MDMLDRLWSWQVRYMSSLQVGQELPASNNLGYREVAMRSYQPAGSGYQS
jgi:hypothetical protein